jgi:hypothetical protein
MNITKPKPRKTWRGDYKLTWYFCDGDCGTILLEGEARAGGCGICRCTGNMRWLDMTEEEFEVYRPKMEEFGIKDFVAGARSGLYKSIKKEYDCNE